MLDLSDKKRVKNLNHWTQEINQLYHPTGDFGQDSQDLVYSFANLNTTKFFPILLKELFFLLKTNGYLIIDYQPNEICDWQKLEETMWWLWKGKYEIVYHGEVREKDLENLDSEKLMTFVKSHVNDPNETTTNSKGTLRFVCQKTMSTLTPEDSIDKWTFGIITNGKRKEWLEKIINSIRAQKIPHYEIIICGTYAAKTERDTIYLPFNRRDNKGWITKKKNYIAQRAKYENLCILHDRMVPHKDWFRGMKEWGNCFEVLSVEQRQESTNKPGNHWEYSYLRLYKKLGRYSIKTILHSSFNLDPRDWFESVIIYGQAIICKKSVYLSRLQNETLYWQTPEDHVFSRDLIEAGFIPRYNNKSLLINLDNRNWGNETQVVYSDQNTGLKFKGNPAVIVFRKVMHSVFSYLKKYLLR